MAPFILERARIDIWLTIAGWVWVLYTLTVLSAAALVLK